MKIQIKKYRVPIFIWLLFEALATILWLRSNNIFYFFNFTYIGTCLFIGLALYANKIKFARNMIQIFVGSYMLIYLGLISGENMQIEGFWYYLSLGVFEAAVMHYVIAKIVGPLVFGRGWCGYACWTTMVLDLLPYKVSKNPRKPLGFVRYIMFGVSLAFVVALLVFQITNLPKIMFWSFIAGNLIYYAVGITMAFALKDNRAFCKYICPVTLFLKPASYYSLLRIYNDESKCNSCQRCKRACPMDVNMTDNSRRRLNGTECILCLDCVDACPRGALRLGFSDKSRHIVHR